MRDADPVLAIIGAGPRAVGLLERLAANGPLLDGRALTIHVIDPHPPGAGKVWRQDQSPLLLMNSRVGEVTMFTDSSTTCAGPVRPGPTLHEWSSGADATLVPDPGLAAEASALNSGSFASRRLAGQYLEWCFRQAARALPDSVRLRVHQATAVGLRPGRQHRVTLSNGVRLDADIVVLAVGDVGGYLTPGQQAHVDFALRSGGCYLPPSDAGGNDDLDKLPAGEPVIVAGLGLAFIDLMVLLTQGRGGRFERDREGRLRYRASGHEPVLHVGSRRGVPYLPKPGQELARPAPDGPRFFTAGRVRDILAQPDTARAGLLACAVRELAWAYYREVFTAHPDLTTCSLAAFTERFDALAITDPALGRVIEQAVPDAGDRFDLRLLRPPLAGVRFPGQPSLNRWMRDRIGATVRRSTDMRHSAHAALLPAVIDISRQLELLSGTSPGDGLARLSRPLGRLFSFLGSGPPPHRLEELIALCDAGVVNFLGAGLAVGHDPTEGQFVASSDTLAVTIPARHLVEARLPDTDISSGQDPLLAGLGGASRLLAADKATFHVLDPRGQPVPRLLAMGAFATGGALGSLSRPGRDAAFFHQNDAAAQWVLRTITVGHSPAPAGRGGGGAGG
jgi:hypothetical protein